MDRQTDTYCTKTHEKFCRVLTSLARGVRAPTARQGPAPPFSFRYPAALACGCFWTSLAVLSYRSGICLRQYLVGALLKETAMLVRAGHQEKAAVCWVLQLQPTHKGLVDSLQGFRQEIESSRVCGEPLTVSWSSFQVGCERQKKH
jgi:hypothetical protein